MPRLEETNDGTSDGFPDFEVENPKKHRYAKISDAFCLNCQRKLLDNGFMFWQNRAWLLYVQFEILRGYIGIACVHGMT